MKNSMNISLSPVLSDYELLDSGDFEKLERFGRYVTRRPEPQAIWHRSLTEEELEETLNALEGGYDYDRRGLRLLRFGRHVQLATRPDYAKYVEKLLQPVQKQSLSQAVMETLAVIAYRQPVTKAEIELIRGVKCDYSVQMLVSRGLIEEVGRKEALGRPILYGTTDAFLRHFCLTSLGDLPEIDFSALAEKIAEAEAKQASEAPKADPVDKLAQNIAKEKG